MGAAGGLLLALGLGIAGCGDSGGGRGGESQDAGQADADSDGGAIVAPARACTRTEALSEPRGCRVDDDCACGAHCQLGACRFDCRGDDDCDDGEACDDFGRCAPAGAPRVRFTVATRNRTLDTATQTLRVAALGTPVPLSLTPFSEDGGPVRVVAGEGALLWCSLDAEPSSSCELDALAQAGQALGVGLAEGAGAAGAQGSVEIYDAAGQRRVIQLTAYAPAAPPAPTSFAELDGHYRGLGRLGDSSGLMGEVENGRALEPVIEADIYADASSGVIALIDRSGMLLPDPLVATLRWANDKVQIALPAVRWLDGSDFISDALSVEVPLSHTLDLALPLTFSALSLDAAQPLRALLRLTLAREGDRQAGARPAPTPDALAQADKAGALPGAAALYAALEVPGGVLSLLDTRTLYGCANVSASRAARPALLRAMCDELYVPREFRFEPNPENALPLDVDACGNTAADGSARILCQLLTTSRTYERRAGVPTFRFDACDEMAQRTDGTIDRSQKLTSPYTALGAGEQEVAVGQAMLDAWPGVPGSPSYCYNPEGVLQVPPIPDDESGCAAASLCTIGLSEANTAQGLTHLSPITGDALCDGRQTSSLAPGLEQFPQDLPSFLDGCAEDLAAAARPGEVDPGVLSEARPCLNSRRLWAVYERAIAATRAGQGTAAGQALAQRTLTQLLLTQEVEARLAADVYREAAALADQLPTESVLGWLEASQAPWVALFDARVAAALRALPAEVLQDPDPRPRFGLTPDAAAPPGPAEGIAVALLEAAAAPAELLALLLDQAWREGNAAGQADLRARFGSMARTGQLAAVLATDLHDRAATLGTPAWESAWQAARARYALSLMRVVERLADIDAGNNPMGLSERDLPIVFPGEPANDRDRFLAVSRFLIGSGPGDPRAVAPRAVSEAAAALEDARAQWRVRTDIDLTTDRRIEDITRRYGELITGYCGAPIDDPSFDVDSFNVLGRPLDTQTCFIEPRCRTRAEAYKEQLTAAELAYELCVVAGALEAFPGATGVTPALRSALSLVSPHLRKGKGAWDVSIAAFLNPSPNARSVRSSIGGATVEVPVDAYGRLPAQLPVGLFEVVPGTFDPETRPETPVGRMADLIGYCGARRAATEALRPQGVPGSCVRADSCPLGYSCIENRCVAPGPDPLDAVDCYFDGAIAEQALAVRAAGRDVEIARAELEEFAARYDIAKRSCIQLRAGQDEIDALIQQHNNTLNQLDAARSAAVAVAAAAEALGTCANGVEQGASGGASCAAALVQAAAEATADGLQTRMNQVEREHEAEVREIEANIELARCFNDASMELVGAKAASLRVTQALANEAQAVIKLRGQKSYTAALWVEGRIAVENERRRLARALPGRTALSSAAELFGDRFRYAQRLTYLAVRAVEHELQSPLAQARRAALSATRPVQLEQVLRTLTSHVANGTVNGSQPTGLQVVVSLRDHLLQLRDRSDNPPGEHTLTPQERLRLLLSDSRYAVYDAQGNYLGQQIPFSLHPLHTLGLGQAQGIPVFAQNDCAERIFAINAAVVGDDLLRDGATFTRLDLLQRNTFYSQRCGATDEPFQVASVRPSINLLADYSDLSQQNPEDGALDGFTRGQMRPYVNVDRAEFEREDYAQGGTTQLAGRGLYADYALFLPAGALSVNGGPGLRLERIDDILLRIDYVAAAR